MLFSDEHLQHYSPPSSAYLPPAIDTHLKKNTQHTPNVHPAAAAVAAKAIAAARPSHSVTTSYSSDNTEYQVPEYEYLPPPPVIHSPVGTGADDDHSEAVDELLGHRTVITTSRPALHHVVTPGKKKMGSG